MMNPRKRPVPAPTHGAVPAQKQQIQPRVLYVLVFVARVYLCKRSKEEERINRPLRRLVREECDISHKKTVEEFRRLLDPIYRMPAALLIVCTLFLVDMPNSLIERGRLEEGRAVLRKNRGIDNVEPEFNEIMEASRVAQEVKHPFRSLLRRRSRPQLAIAVLLQIFQQLSGINAIMFYAPVLFNTLGFVTDTPLYSAVITGGVNVLSTLVSVYSVDRAGRRMLLLEAGVYMLLSHVAIAIVFRIKVADRSDDLGHDWSVFVVVMVCVFVFSYAWSWGPLGWLIPSETFPLETRSVRQSVAVGVNMLFTFVFAQTFLSVLCHLKYAIFVFFSVCAVVMSLFVLFFLPETKNVPMEEMMERVWKQHWFWKRFMVDGDNHSVVVISGRSSEAEPNQGGVNTYNDLGH